MANALGKNFRKGISIIELFQFKIFIFPAHSGVSSCCLFGEFKSTGYAAFFQNFRTPDLSITHVVGILYSPSELVCERSVFWQTPNTLEPLNEQSE